MVRADADITPGMKFRSSLAYKNHAANHALAAELLDAEARPAESRPLRDEPPAFLWAMNLAPEP